MLTLLRITEQLLDLDSSPNYSGTVLCNGDHMSMSNYAGSDSDARNYPQHDNHHRHHRPHQGCSACLDKKPLLNRSMKTVSFGADEQFVSDDNSPVDNRAGDDRPDAAGGSTEDRRAVRAKVETGKLRSWISVVGDINELSSEPERGTSGIPHKDYHQQQHHQSLSPAVACARKRRERNRSIPTDGPAMTDIETPLAKPRRNSDGATIIRRFLVTPVEDTHEDWFADMLPPPPLPKTPPPSEPTSLVFVGECPVDISPCVRPSILKKASSPDSAPKSILRNGTFTLHTSIGSDTLTEAEPQVATLIAKSDANTTSGAVDVAAVGRNNEEKPKNCTESAIECGFKAKLRSDVDHELVRGPENRLPTTLKSGISDNKVVTVDEWLGDRGVDFDPVESPTRRRLRRSISDASGLRQKKVSFDLEHVDVFLLDQDLISDEQSAVLNERFRQFLDDSVGRANQGSLQQQGESTTSAVPASDADNADRAIINDSDREDGNGIELVKKTLTDDDKTWLKT